MTDQFQGARPINAWRHIEPDKARGESPCLRFAMELFGQREFYPTVAVDNGIRFRSEA